MRWKIIQKTGSEPCFPVFGMTIYILVLRLMPLATSERSVDLTYIPVFQCNLGSDGGRRHGLARPSGGHPGHDNPVNCHSPLGGGLGGLDWNDVQPRIEEALSGFI